MKNYILTFLLFPLFFSCSSNQETIIERPSEKATAFTNKASINNNVISAYGADNPDYMPLFLVEANQISFENRNSSLDGIKKLDVFMDKMMDEEPTNIRTKVDIQVITFTHFKNFVFESINNPEVNAIAKKSVERIISFTKVHEWKLLYQLLEIAKPSMDERKYQELKNSITQNAKQMLSELSTATSNPEINERLVADAKWVINFQKN